ncbi:MAG: IPTL-CTERM sorting domain-containing protein [bacterium]
MNQLKSSAISILGAVFFSAHAAAGVIVVEPDNFAAGTDLSNAVPGVTLSTTDGGAVYSADCTPSSTGSRGFSRSNSSCSDWSGLDSGTPFPTPYANEYSGTNGIMRVDFNQPTAFVSIDIIPNDSNDPHAAGIYDASGNLLDSQSFPGQDDSGVTTTVIFNRAGSDIAFMLVSGIGGQTNELDNLQFGTAEPVPAIGPVGLALAALGLGGLGAARMRKKS